MAGRTHLFPMVCFTATFHFRRLGITATPVLSLSSTAICKNSGLTPENAGLRYGVRAACAEISGGERKTVARSAIPHPSDEAGRMGHPQWGRASSIDGEKV